MSMKELPALESGKTKVYGTYFAEQVSEATYDLLSVSCSEHRRPATQGSTGGASAEASPGRGRGRRRHAAREQVWGFSEKPAGDPYSGLLPEADQESQLADHENRRKQREDRVTAYTERIRCAAERLARGEHCHHRRRRNQGKPSDEEYMKELTAPLESFRSSAGFDLESSRQSAAGGGHGPTGPVGLAFSLAAFSSPHALTKKVPSRVKRHQHYRDAFTAGLAGTELAALPLRLKGPLASPLQLKRQAAGAVSKDRVSLSTFVELQEIPLDPVDAFFKAEEAAQREKEKLEEARAGSPSGAKNRGAQLRALLKNAVYKEDGILAQAAQARGGAVSRQPSKTPSMAPGADEGHLMARTASKSSSCEQPGSASAIAAGKNGADGQLTDLIDALMPKAKISTLRKEACELLRKFTFGQVGNEKKAKAEKEKIFQESIGTREQVAILFSLWEKMDIDGSGTVEVHEFRTFVDRLVCEAKGAQGPERRPSITAGWKVEWAGLSHGHLEEVAKKLCDRVSSLLFSRRHLAVEDLMRIIWPFSALEQLRQMRSWCDELPGAHHVRVASPPQALPKAELDDLRGVFQFHEKDRCGYVTVEELVTAGLLDKDVKHSFFESDGDGRLDVQRFCELLCPTGWRAREDSLRGTTEDGQSCVYDPRLGGWRLEEPADVHAAAS